MNGTAATDKQWFGHPRGLATLFFTEMWERFSFYGMRALLMLFMVATAAEGGLGFAPSKAGAIYGLYTASAYGLNLAGGWIADRILGQRGAVFWGGVLIAIGNFTLVIPSVPTFYLGLMLVAIGTGLLKPNVSTIVGDLYPEGGFRRDAGFSIFYMGINVGAMLGPIICGLLRQNLNWHWAFAASGIGMVLGLVQYKMTGKYLGDSGTFKLKDGGEAARRRDIRSLSIALVVLAGLGALLVYLAKQGVVTITAETIGRATGVFILVVVIAYFLYLMTAGGLSSDEKKGVGVIFLLFLAAAIFWAGFEQAGTSMNIFADQLTDRVILGWEMPTEWLQSVNSVFIILLAPVFAAIWQMLGRRNRNPSMGIKFSWGLILLGVGFLVLVWAATHTQTGVKVLPTWLVATYFFHTLGELCLSPVGLSSITKLAPRRLGGQMMGIWFMGSALGNLEAGVLGGEIAGNPTPGDFGFVAAVSIGAGLVLPIFFLGRWAKDAMAKAEGR